MRLMKESGVKWIGKIPNDWSVTRTKYVADSFSKGSGITKEDVVVEGDIQCVRYGELYSRYDGVINKTVSKTKSSYIHPAKHIQKGDILFACTGELVEEIGKNVVYMGEEACLAGGDIIVLSHSQDPVFLNYALNCTSSQSQKSSGKTKLKVVHISENEISNVWIAVPPIEKQKDIGRFLDKQYTCIDNIIEKTKASIEEYKKLKQAIITQAVTKGVRGDRQMKNSGVDWIGEIPEEWETIRIKWLLDERNERSQLGEEEPLSMSQKYGLIPTKEMDSIPNMASSFIGAKIVHCGDLVFNKLKAHLGVFAVSNHEGLVSPDYAVYFPSGLADMKYLEYLFKTPQYINEFKKKSTGVGAGLTRLYTGDLYSIYCALPSIKEQLQIVDYIDTKLAKMNDLITKKEKTLIEFESYKKALIYEYVTGKKEVPSA